ncbi:hypothetical protein M9Y10_025879 [Tritrichomonas musculus]|uniref:Uncharacterized protein n=1 Tax=Tritrichomonas musculus TaxID=1915356 RepID=A0ABR2H7T8_9EUKA
MSTVPSKTMQNWWDLINLIHQNDESIDKNISDILIADKTILEKVDDIHTIMASNYIQFFSKFEQQLKEILDEITKIFVFFHETYYNDIMDKLHTIDLDINHLNTKLNEIKSELSSQSYKIGSIETTLLSHGLKLDEILAAVIVP